MSEPTGQKAALVTGAAKRIGHAIARDLARHGWAVAVHYHHSAAEAAELVREIEAGGGRAVALQADLAREEHTHALVARAVEALGPLTCLVNNASLFEMDKIETVTRASWDAHLETNLRAPLVLSQDFAGQLPAGAHGNIVNMLDQRVWNLTPYFLSYTIAKMGLWTLTRTLALALAPRIRVNGIGPGPTLPSPRQSPEQFAEQCRAMPLGRGTTLEEICAALQFILSAPAMTGQMIALDGGQHLGWAQALRGYVARE
jgi:NAD(P)-dependent dehydrogenase (short-subunit alcohol dehydrogenase family)